VWVHDQRSANFRVLKNDCRAGTPAAGDFVCSDCGFLITVFQELPLCPNCGCDSWAELPVPQNNTEMTEAVYRHHLRTSHCPSLPRFVGTPSTHWTGAEQAHISSCRYCQMIVAAAWRESCPPRRELLQHALDRSRNASAVNEHMVGDHCQRCRRRLSGMKLAVSVLKLQNSLVKRTTPLWRLLSGHVLRPIDRGWQALRPYLLGTSASRAAMRRFASTSLLVVLDGSGIIGGIYCGLLIRDAFNGKLGGEWGRALHVTLNWFPVAFGILALAFLRSGLYASRDRGQREKRVLSELLFAAALTLAVIIAVSGLSRPLEVYPWATVIGGALILFLRNRYELVTAKLLHAAGVQRRVIIVGEPSLVPRLRRSLGKSRFGIDYRFLGLVPTVRRRGSAPKTGLATLGRFSELAAVLGEHGPNELIVAPVGLTQESFSQVREAAARYRVRLYVPSPSYSYQRGEPVSLVEVIPRAFAGPEWAVKRGLDLLISAAVLVVGLPVWALIISYIRLSTGGPVVSRHRRIGYMGQEFDMWKFGHGVVRGQDTTSSLRIVDRSASAPQSETPRLVRLLQRYRVDDIPQLLNVIRGEMAIVGPRPLEIVVGVRRTNIPTRRQLVPPGITGLCQIASHPRLDHDRRVRLDLEYLDRWSPWLDASILMKTVSVVVTQKPARVDLTASHRSARPPQAWEEPVLIRGPRRRVLK